MLFKDSVHGFRRIVYEYYKKYHRNLPWRNTRNPYHIFISEVMLQQTQVDRVILKYEVFIQKLPGFRALADVPVRTLLTLWQGLGYNRRALSLKKAAQIIVKEYNGSLPDNPDILITLPNIGKATAASISAFAFNKPAIIIETNIRTVFIHHFFPNKEKVHDCDLRPYIECTLDKRNPAKWYNALMDYGVYLKKQYPGLTQRSSHYKKQSPFKDSDRRIRGRIIAILIKTSKISIPELKTELMEERNRITRILESLINEGFIRKEGRLYYLNR